MSEDSPDSLIPYDEIVQEALRAVVGRVLREVVEGGGHLPGRHHFYITFKTAASGVDIPRHLTERYPDEMTIVLENRFWDLTVGDDYFSVGLSFNQVGSILTIPFAAITAFADPSVEFGLQFQVDETAAEIDPPEAPNNDASDAASADGSNVVSVDFGRRK